MDAYREAALTLSAAGLDTWRRSRQRCGDVSRGGTDRDLVRHRIEVGGGVTTDQLVDHGKAIAERLREEPEADVAHAI